MTHIVSWAPLPKVKATKKPINLQIVFSLAAMFFCGLLVDSALSWMLTVQNPNMFDIPDDVATKYDASIYAIESRKNNKKETEAWTIDMFG